ncbi:MAG: deoxyribose-phosphate aldolase [Candidatus Melainabacteria bacterium]|nr:deoxyribose-phosphate aldolase [Candidatus Melainabacteria bacterium]MBI3308981.1 deoxyribose-phosphate aldolase [Candidatus Melainabacteria bacterium]
MKASGVTTLDLSLKTKYTSAILAKTIDQSILKPTSTTQDFEEAVKEAKQFGYRSLCVHPCKVNAVKSMLSGTDVLIAVVCDFPHGRGLTNTRVADIKELLKLGVDEIDIVSRYERIREGDLEEFETDTRAVIKAMGGKPLKIILEVDTLTKDQIRNAVKIIGKIVKEEKAKNIIVKTKTGFVDFKMANLDAVHIIKETLEGMDLYAKTIDEIQAGKIGVKASGGVKTKEDAIELLEAGAHILGSSSGAVICS